MSGSDHSTTTLKDFCGLAQEKHQRNKHSGQQSTVRLWTAGGRLTVDVGHAVVAAPDAVIDMARREAGVAPDAFWRGEVL